MHTTTPALTRTWRTEHTAEMDRVVVSVSTHTVTLRRAFVGGPLSAEVDGQPADVARAVALLEGARRVEVLAEDLAPAPIGKARACRLHKIMGRLGLPSAQHYALAAAALGEWAPLGSLAALTEREARSVWAHLCRLYPQARELAAA